MATILQTYATEESITVIGLDSLVKTGELTVEIDNSTNKHLADDYDVEITSGIATGTIDIYRAGSNNTGDVPGTGDVSAVWNFVKSLDMSATKQKVDFRLEQLKKYNTLLFINNCDVTTTGYTITRVGADLTNA